MEHEWEQDSSNTLKIYCCCYEENIYPWIQNDLRTPSWRFYWNPVPGGFLRAEGKEIPLLPEYFYILPGYFCFSTLAKTPFSQFLARGVCGMCQFSCIFAGYLAHSTFG